MSKILRFKIPKKIEVNKKCEKPEITTFSGWSKLATELKMEIVGYLDYHTRTKLSQCSKSDYNLVNPTPIQFHALLVTDEGYEDRFGLEGEFPNVSIAIEFGREIIDENDIHIYFVKKDNDTEICWAAPRTDYHRPPHLKHVSLKNCDYYEEAEKFIEKWMKQSRYSVKSLIIDMTRNIFGKAGITRLNSCEQMKLYRMDEVLIRWFLERAGPNMKDLQISNGLDHPTLSTKLLSMDAVKQCDILRLERPCNLTDGIFSSLSASIFWAITDSISNLAIAELIQSWRYGKLRNNFSKLRIIHNNKFSLHQIIDFRRTKLNPRGHYEVQKSDGNEETMKLQINDRSLIIEV